VSEVTVYGAFDDLVEIEGDLNEEFNPSYDGEGMLLAFGDGTVLDVRYDDNGVWRITQREAGSASFEKVEAPPDDKENYSDRVTLRGELRWVMAGENLTLLRIPSSVAVETM
jgi:hypothetical protein